MGGMGGIYICGTCGKHIRKRKMQCHVKTEHPRKYRVLLDTTTKPKKRRLGVYDYDKLKNDNKLGG